MCDDGRGSRLVAVTVRTDAGTADVEKNATRREPGARRPEPAPRPAMQTAGVPTPRIDSPMTALARTGRPVLWLAVAAGTVWPLTPTAIAAGLIALAGGVCAVVAARDPRIPSVTGEGERWRTFLLSVCTLTGLVAIVLEPRGAGYVCGLVAAALIGRIVIDARIIWGFSAVAGIAVGLTMAYALGSPWALLIGLAAPALASRSLDRARLHREHARVLALLAERDALRGRELAAAAGRERARIARDLHDVLAHTLSGLSLHLQGIRAVAAKRLGADDPVIASVDRAADLARAGLAEAKQAVAALRADPDEEAAPSTADVTALADGHDAALTVTGDLDGVGPRVRDAVFATVREALTNAGRHAPGAAVTITVDVGDAVEVRVTDAGSGSPVPDVPVPGGPVLGGPVLGGPVPGVPVPGPASGTRDAAARGDVGSGHGLVGLAERAALVGGAIEAGPHEEGWRVTLRVPPSACCADPADASGTLAP